MRKPTTWLELGAWPCSRRRRLGPPEVVKGADHWWRVDTVHGPLGCLSAMEAGGKYLILFHIQVQYKKDCKETFGRILNNHNVKSSLQGNSKLEMTEKWSRLYPEEPFELDCSSTSSEEILDKYPGAASSISYDLVSAVKRQSSFCYQVAKPLLPFQCADSI